MAVTTKTLYDTDFAEWAKETAALVRAGRLAFQIARNPVSLTLPHLTQPSVRRHNSTVKQIHGA
jgi:hypothetical protein